MKKEPIIVNVYLWGTCIGNRIMIYVLPPIPREPLCLRLFMEIGISYIKGFRNFLRMRFLIDGDLPCLTSGSRITI